MKEFKDPNLAKIFKNYPKKMRNKLMFLRRLIFDTAAKTKTGKLANSKRLSNGENPPTSQNQKAEAPFESTGKNRIQRNTQCIFTVRRTWLKLLKLYFQINLNLKEIERLSLMKKIRFL